MILTLLPPFPWSCSTTQHNQETPAAHPNEPTLIKADNPLAAVLITAEPAKRIGEKLLYPIHLKHSWAFLAL